MATIASSTSLAYYLISRAGDIVVKNFMDALVLAGHIFVAMAIYFITEFALPS